MRPIDPYHRIKRDGWISKRELREKRKQAHKRVNRWLRRFCYR
jgi:hypothetical protein